MPYKDVQMMDLDDHLQAFTWQEDGEVWIYAGTCPRCGHRVTKRFIPEVLLAFQESEGDVQDRTMRCDCGEAHGGREAGSLGCGAWWGLALSRK